MRFRISSTTLFILFCLSLCLYFSSAVPLSADPLPGAFTQYDFDCGGYVTGFAAHASGSIYCRANVGGVYRSDDHGQSWHWLSGDLHDAACHMPQGLAVARSGPDIVIQAVGTGYLPNDPGRGIWKSTNGGRTWRHVLRAVNFSGNDDPMYGGPCLVEHPSRDCEFWAVSRGQGVYVSRDAGNSWRRTGGGHSRTVFTGLSGPPITACTPIR